MSTIKISELPVLTALSANNANTIFVAVDRDTQTTGQFSTTVLSQVLFANNILNVGTSDPSNFVGLVAQFIANNSPYGQVNFQNIDSTASMDVILTADTGDDSNNFVDLGINNSNFTDPTYSAMKQKDGYLFVSGSSASNYVGNLVIGTTTSEANVLFSVGGTSITDIASKMTKNGLELVNGSYVTFADGTTQSTSAATLAYSQQTNANTIVTQGVDATQNTNISTNATNIGYVNTYAGGAYNKANNAVANTTDIYLPGDLTVIGNANVKQHLVVANSSYDYTNTSLVKILGSTPALLQPSNPGYMLEIVGIDGVSSRVINTGYGTNAYGLYAGRHANGTAASPTATSNNDVIARFSGGGYNGSAFTATGQGRIDIVADENFSVANTGSRIEFYNTIPKTNTVTKIATFNANTVTFTGSVYPQKGFIYTPVIYPGAQTAITLDISDGPLVRAQTSTGLSVTLSNFVAGKVVELWVTNTSGTNQTFTHGVSSINSTVNSTTYSIPGTATICARYVCLDGTLANTMVSVIHA